MLANNFEKILRTDDKETCLRLLKILNEARVILIVPHQSHKHIHYKVCALEVCC
jgi:hypothetical protein